ncbi:hypothetical protein KOY_00271 [Bacillus cereus VDM021]|nr:hypothetical protein IIW_00331 [Bacillus cereus VD136]EOP73110.1 hypothetical protein KOW_00520 [Bacillus cereus VDM006]EOQ14305.1 hypothetical protein KOY_00271 [Bacillus cereus VDM021]
MKNDYYSLLDHYNSTSSQEELRDVLDKLTAMENDICKKRGERTLNEWLADYYLGGD